jgi:hypothetical protein
MRRRWAVLLAVPAILIVATASAASVPRPPVLTLDDALNASLEDVRDVTASPTTRMQASGITAAEAVGLANREWPATDQVATVLTARAAQFPGEAMRPVFVVVRSGGVFPFDGPPDGPVSGERRIARVTGLLIDAETGEFLRGFLHN